MKYMVKFSCGHEHEVELCGKYNERERRIKWYEESGICDNCKEAAKASKLSATCKEIEMHYSEYKNNYAECQTKSGSYNKATKTIIVYVPFTEEEIKAAAEEANSEAEESIESVEKATEETTKEATEASAQGTVIIHDEKYTPDPYMVDFLNSMERVDFKWDDIPDMWASSRKIIEHEDGSTGTIFF